MAKKKADGTIEIFVEKLGLDVDDEWSPEKRLADAAVILEDVLGRGFTFHASTSAVGATARFVGGGKEFVGNGNTLAEAITLAGLGLADEIK